MRIEAPVALKGFVDIVPGKPDLGSMREPAIKLGRGSERFSPKRGYRRGVRPKGSRWCRRHPECSSRGRRCKSDFSGLSA